MNDIERIVSYCKNNPICIVSCPFAFDLSGEYKGCAFDGDPMYWDCDRILGIIRNIEGTGKTEERMDKK